MPNKELRLTGELLKKWLGFNLRGYKTRIKRKTLIDHKTLSYKISASENSLSNSL